MFSFTGSIRRFWVAIGMSLILALASPLAALANVPLLQISSDPYTNPDSQHRTEVEPDTFAFGSTIVSAFQVGRFFSGGASNIGFATSTNGGQSWTQGFLPGTTAFATPAGVYLRASDPVVAYDARHNVWMISYLGIIDPSTGPVDVLVSRSIDGGLTWSNPIIVNNSGDFNDKNWTACDNTATSPFYGNCYTEFDDNTQGDLILMSTSSDGGLTWGAALPTANNAHGLGGQPLVQPNGNVIVPINGFAGQNFLMMSFTSSDGGGSWDKTKIITRIGFHHAAGNIRDSIPLPSAEMDGSGKVYVVWQDCRFEPTCNASDLVMSTSTDGRKWSKITRLPLDPRGSGVDHFIPGLAVDRSTSGNSARLVVTYYYYPNTNCTTATCQLNVGYSTSADGGASWTANTPITGPMSLTWLPNTSQGFMVGDYISTSFSGAPAFPAIAAANAPSGSLFDEATYTVQGGLSVAGSPIAARDQVNAGSNDQPTPSSIRDQ
ncbi:MAG TPA: sialidase family protein [Anaerolineales bacterium]|nr:sialidase family protein [Anaerolineales bacterium]